MAGETIVALARMMEEAPQVGIIQTAPTIVNRESLLARGATVH
jgi:membrane glycosyltransferase